MSKPQEPVAKFVKLQRAAKAFNTPPREFRRVLDQHGIPVVRPTQGRELILEEHLELLALKIAGPAIRPKHLSVEERFERAKQQIKEDGIGRELIVGAYQS
jgi:hypothetical protein